MPPQSYRATRRLLLRLCAYLALHCQHHFLLPPAFAQTQMPSAEREFQSGLALLDQKKYDLAIAAFDSALKLQPYHELTYQKRGLAYRHKLEALYQDANYEDALRSGDHALVTKLRQNDHRTRAVVLWQLGRCYFRLGRYEPALQAHQKSLAEARLARERVQEAEALNGMGLVYRATGEYPKAIDCFEQALTIFRGAPDRRGEGIALGNLGDVHMLMGEYDRAMRLYEAALALLRQAKARSQEAATLGSMANVHFYQGHFEQALALGQQALRINQEQGDRIGEITQLGNLGSTYLELGEYWNGIVSLKQAVASAAAVGDKEHQQDFLSNLGIAYQRLGDYVQASEYIRQAQALAHQMGSRHDEAICFISQGELWYHLKRPILAAASFASALAIFDSLGDTRGQAICSANLGSMHVLAGHLAEAKPFFDRALGLNRSMGDRFGEGETLNSLGDLYRRNGQYSLARQAHEQALAIANESSAEKIIIEARAGLAQNAHAEGKFDEAKQLYLQAIAPVEAVRAQLPAAEQQSHFLASRKEIYDGMIHLLAQLAQRETGAAHEQEAFVYSEKAKARALLDLLAEAKIDLDNYLTSTQKTRQDAAWQHIATLQTKLSQINISSQERQRLEGELAQTERQMQDLVAELRQQNPLYASIKYPKPVTVRRVQQELLRANELALAFALGEEKSYLWVLIPERHFLFPLPPQTEIERAVQAFLQTVGDPRTIGNAHRARGRELYDLILQPADSLVQRAQKITILPDGALHRVPFEALTRPAAAGQGGYLIEQAAIAYAPSATVWSILREGRGLVHSRKSLLAFSDPFFGENESPGERNAKRAAQGTTLTQKSVVAPDSLFAPEALTLRGMYEHLGVTFSRLKYSAAEIDSIARFFPTSLRTLYRRKEATEERVKAEDLSRYALLHFATHGVAYDSHPARSCLVLALDDDPAEDGFLQMGEIYNLKLRAELVVLSACQTARGQLVAGEGLVSLSRAFLYAGAQSVLGTLWPVADDTSPPRLMSRFYGYLLQGKSRGAALRLAKLDLLLGETAAHRHPFYWAGYVLMGSDR